jgi:lipoprotein-releasing system ATP-binding protein
METMVQSEAILTAHELTKRFYRPSRQTILDQVSLSIHSGDVISISGRSGAGKSTLLQLLGTLDTPCSGQLTIAGNNVTLWNQAALRNKYLGFIFQSFHLLNDYTALENVLVPLRIARISTHAGSDAYRQAEELLAKVGLVHRMHHKAKLLSGGEKQRVAIARALCNNPSIIFADEPTGNLDQQTAAEIHDLLLGCASEHGKALVIVSHDPVLIGLCEKRYYLEEGRLVI